MSDWEATRSDLVEIAKRNGDFRKNYGLLVGAFLYLRSINAARPRLFWWQAVASPIGEGRIDLQDGVQAAHSS